MNSLRQQQELQKNLLESKVYQLDFINNFKIIQPRSPTECGKLPLEEKMEAYYIQLLDKIGDDKLKE